MGCALDPCCLEGTKFYEHTTRQELSIRWAARSDLRTSPGGVRQARDTPLALLHAQRAALRDGCCIHYHIDLPRFARFLPRAHRSAVRRYGDRGYSVFREL
jgi:hypothetical protein